MHIHATKKIETNTINNSTMSLAELDPIAEARQRALDNAVADLRDFMARARRLRLQFDYAKQEELTAYHKVQACQESLAHCYANNPFGGMNDIIERRKAQLAEAERAWQETTLYVAQLRAEVAEVSEMEIERFTPEVAQRMREQDELELACANEMIVDGTTKESAPKSLEAIKVVSKDADIRTAMVYGSPENRPVTAADRALALSRSSPSRGASPTLAGRIGSSSSTLVKYTVVGNEGSVSQKEVALPQISATTGSRPVSASALVLANFSSGLAHEASSNGSPQHHSPSRPLPFSLTPVRSSAGQRIGSAIVVTSASLNPSSPGGDGRMRVPQEAANSGLRQAAATASVVPGVGVRSLPSAIRGTAQSPLTMSAIDFKREGDEGTVVVARPGHYAEQSALRAADDSNTLDGINHISVLTSAEGGDANPEKHKTMINGQLPQIALSPSQQKALEHSPFFRPGSAIIYAAADATAIRARRENNLDNSKPILLNPQSVGRDRRPLARPAYHASPAAEKVKHSITTPNTPLTENELTALFNGLDRDGDNMLKMVEVAVHFDHVGTFGIPNHSKNFIQTNLKRPFEAGALVSFDEFAFLVAKWGTL